MNILLIGGCLNRQKGIPKEKHYHNILSTLIADYYGVVPNIDFAFYSSFMELENIVKTSVNNAQSYNYIVLFIRPYPIIPLTKVLVKYKRKDLSVALALHPAFSKNKYYDLMADERSVSSDSSSLTGYPLFKWLNVNLGKALGLHAWSIREVLTRIESAAVMVEDSASKLLLVGPPLYPAFVPVNEICLSLNDQLKSRSTIHIDIAGQVREEKILLDKDGIHFTEEGHVYIANNLFKALIS